MHDGAPPSGTQSFWKLVQKSVPRLEEAKDWLRNEGSDLHRYGV